MYIHMYMCVCVSILWQHKFGKMMPSGSFFLICPKKKGELGKDQHRHRCGEPWPKKPFEFSMPKKGENYHWEKEATFIGKNRSICSMTPESP